MNKNSKKIKVLFVTNLFPNSQEPNRGIFSYYIVKELQKLCDVTIIAPIPWSPDSRVTKILPKQYQTSQIPNREILDSIVIYHPKYLVIPKISGFAHGLSMYFSIQKLIRKIHQWKKIDIINARWVFPDGFATALIANQMKIPFVVSALGCDINLYTSFWLRKPQIIYTLRKAGIISTVSIALKEKIQELGISSDKIRCIYNGIDTNIFFPKDKLECRKKLGLDEGSKIILFVGGIVSVKGIEYLIQAFEYLIRSGHNNLHLILVGDGPNRNEFENEVERSILKQKVFFIGNKPHQEIADWINASDLLCLPSIREGRPNVVIEALACGKPVVASNVGGVPELVNQTNGILVKPKDSIELAKAIIQALNRSWLSGTIVDSIQSLSWKSCAEQFVSVYETLVKSKMNRVCK